MSESRTRKSIINAQVSLFFAIVGFLLSFFSRPIFLDALGVEVVGLRTTVGGFLSMLSLAELGIGSAIAVSLYKPLNEGDTTTISEVVSLQGWLYRIIASVVLFAAVILSFFFPRIFADMKAPLWYAYAMYFVFVTSTMLSYTVTYKSIVLSADQKGYKVAKTTQGMQILKGIIQILVLKFGSGEYLFLYWLGLEFGGSLFGLFWLERVTRREYPWMSLCLSKGRLYMKKHPHILKNTARIFVHQIASVALNQTTPMVTFAFASLVVVGLYGNYMIIVTSVGTLVGALYGSIGSGIGSLVAEGNKPKTIKFFWEMIAFRYFMVSIVVFGMLSFSQGFISVWLGAEYLLGLKTLALIILVSYIGFTRVLDPFIAAHALYHDIWAPMLEAGLNIGLSILLGYYWGLDGILMGVAISLIVIVRLWKPYFLFKEGFKEPVVSGYWRNYLKYPVLCWGLSLVGMYLVGLLELQYVTFWDFIRNAAIITPIFTLVTFGIFLAVSEGFRNIMKRFWAIAARRFAFLPQID